MVTGEGGLTSDIPSSGVFVLGLAQPNATVIGFTLMLRQGVVAPTSGHVSMHEEGVIERDGHQVIELAVCLGKVTAEQLDICALAWERDANRDHMVQLGMAYLS